MLKRFAAAAGVALAVLLAPASSWGTSPGRNGKLVFASGERLHTIAPDGSGLAAVPTTSCEGLEPDWHPNGRTIGFIERCGPSGTFDLSVVDVDGSALRRVYWTFADDAAIDWSPDGSKVLFISEAIGNREIYVSDPGFTDVTNLTDDVYKDDWPAWSPDGSKIAFSSNRTGNFEIYTMNADGTGVTNLTNHPAPDGDGSRRAGGPSGDHDGRKIAFDSARTGQDEIFSMDANGGGVQQLTEGGTNLEPAWSPDGRLIAFASDRRGNRDLFLMSSDGTNQVPLMTSPAFDERPDWQVLPVGTPDDEHEDRCDRHHRDRHGGRRGGHRRERKCRPKAHSGRRAR